MTWCCHSDDWERFATGQSVVTALASASAPPVLFGASVCVCSSVDCLLRDGCFYTDADRGWHQSGEFVCDQEIMTRLQTEVSVNSNSAVICKGSN